MIFEAGDPKQIYKYEIVDNQILKGNIASLHKQVFIKEKTMPQIDQRKQKKTVGIDGFKKAVKKKVVKPAPPPAPTDTPDEEPKTENSLLSTILEAQDPNAFVIQPPEKKSKLLLESKIYFWETS